MNSTSLEKPKKGNLYVYKFGTGSKTPEYQPPTAVTVTKRIISWGLGKSKSKPKTGLDPDKEKGENINGIRNSDEKVKENIKGDDNTHNGRKSVSSVANERKPVKDSNNETPKYATKITREKNGKVEITRKSVSHVENKKAYVGKFVEKARKSTGAKMESNVETAITLLQVKVLVTDMPGFMQIHAFQCARITYDSLEKFSAKHLASNLKKEFDKVYGPAWHCIVGSSFGSFVTHATGCFLYFSMEKLCILLFRTKVQRDVQE